MRRMDRIKSIEAFSARGYRNPCEIYSHNEDALVVSLNTFGVIDGAKPPTDVEIQGLTSAAFFVGVLIYRSLNILITKLFSLPSLIHFSFSVA